ncbi:YfaP family protein [Maribacter sp. 1_MG-2023]|uniref:YfaP family protein n=1 Tax=Maribacter sp. 1_MG-2023 TaxID=3062677 RepID=UPI0026E42497|nr:TonB-dependent receptor plug domain-containing protein [Maribacter sp. 1_MG-2023]MDO6471925.1 TonB-dependent receptor plug domain-containing protein [Maribacter sp. 1_MG-2023]
MLKVNSLVVLLILIGQCALSQVESKKVTICWDTSLSMIERDIEKEFGILDKIFERNPTFEVQLILFNAIVEERKFEIKDGNWNKLREVLVNTRPDGATLYEVLDNNILNSECYFFTDGNSLVQNDFIPVKKGNIVINSVRNRNLELLEKSVLIGKGRLMDLSFNLNDAVKPTNDSKKYLKSVRGTIYLDNEPKDRINVQILGKEKVYLTDKNGKFWLPAIPGDSLLISDDVYGISKILPIGYYENELDIFLGADVTNLEGVTVVQKRIENYGNTAIDSKEKESIGYAVQSLDSEDISPITTDVSMAVAGKFSNVNLKSDQDITEFSARPNATILGNRYGLVVVDGVPIEQSNSSGPKGFSPDSGTQGYTADASFLNPENIASITVLKGLAATNRYGTLGNGGVLLVTTKTAQASNGTDVKVNSALLQNNIYNADYEREKTDSAILSILQNTTSIEEAYDQYLILRNFNETNDSFYLDAFSFFKDTDKDIAAKIISNFWEKDPKNEAYLRITELAMRYLGFDEVSALLNRQLNELKPLALQPFFTEVKLKLAKSEKQEALDMLTNLENGGAYGNLDVQPIQKSIERELKNLIFRDRLQLDVTKVKEKYFSNSKMNVRLLVEWSNPKSEFQIQFVNPQNRFFNWEHTTSADAKRIQDEVELGFSMEEFELYEDIKGEWIINATYIGNLDQQSTMPLALLCTVYTNFGYPSQSEEKIILHLTNENANKRIVSLKI